VKKIDFLRKHGEWRIKSFMECPDCHCELPSRECPQCSENIPVFGKFCCYCGSALPDLDSIESDEDGIDFSNRTLCRDGSCIGVINEHGVCSECGKPYTAGAE
jgi:hypothetical protein